MLPALRYEVEAGTPQGLADWLTVYERAVNDLADRISSATKDLNEAG